MLKVAGNTTTGCLLLTGDMLTTCIGGVFRGLADVVDCMCGSGENTARKKIAWHPQKYSNAPIQAQKPANGAGFGELDVEATMRQSTFPIAPEKLIQKAKEVMATEFGTAPGEDGSCLAEDFQFVAPIVGPLSKNEFRAAFGSFKLRDAVPDLSDNSWFQVDPLEPNRVWFFSRSTGTQTGPMNFGGQQIPASNAKILMPPQAQSMLFNEEGKCYTLTVGYCMDKRIGNTEGLGGVFGILKAIGKPLPFPEGQRLYTPSMRYEAFERIAKAAEGCGFGPQAQMQAQLMKKKMP
eukprot:CAMPEP_0168416250 /NCGR_PEP_ID=MMETSP0228-20121227/30646_1 /TAXON_ID=133427 /ORGANISM="Protoceratium reticulatum, Strain CCCM 535 (=CCMP 1889)" /LENGTH=292 /DNA_ID=CAMNT_0008430075 /DNA_START=73 /DNA_END=951 /DNA_ORIENTATION=-